MINEKELKEWYYTHIYDQYTDDTNNSAVIDILNGCTGSCYTHNDERYQYYKIREMFEMIDLDEFNEDNENRVTIDYDNKIIKIDGISKYEIDFDTVKGYKIRYDLATYTDAINDYFGVNILDYNIKEIEDLFFKQEVENND